MSFPRLVSYRISVRNLPTRCPRRGGERCKLQAAVQTLPPADQLLESWACRGWGGSKRRAGRALRLSSFSEGPSFGVHYQHRGAISAIPYGTAAIRYPRLANHRSPVSLPTRCPGRGKGMRYAQRSIDHPSSPALPLRESCHVAWIGVLLSRFWPKHCHCVCCMVSVRWRRAQVVVCQHIGQN